LAKAANYTRNSLGLDILSTGAIEKLVGQGIDYLIRNICNPYDKNSFLNAKNIFLSYYSDHLLDNTKSIKGIPDVLETLKHYPMAVVTNKLASFAEKILINLKLRDYFMAVIARDGTLRKKPYPDPLLLAIKRLNATTKNAVMIGDSRFDIEAGRLAGVKTIGVSWGFGSPEELMNAKPDAIVHIPEELLTLLLTEQ